MNYELFGQDLDEILDYFLVRNINAGSRFIREFNKKAHRVNISLIIIAKLYDS